MVTRRDLLPDALMVVGKHWLARSPASAGTPGKERVCEALMLECSTCCQAVFCPCTGDTGGCAGWCGLCQEVGQLFRGTRARDARQT